MKQSRIFIGGHNPPAVVAAQVNTIITVSVGALILTGVVPTANLTINQLPIPVVYHQYQRNIG